MASVSNTRGHVLQSSFQMTSVSTPARATTPIPRTGDQAVDNLIASGDLVTLLASGRSLTYHWDCSGNDCSLHTNYSPRSSTASQSHEGSSSQQERSEAERKFRTLQSRQTASEAEDTLVSPWALCIVAAKFDLKLGKSS